MNVKQAIEAAERLLPGMGAPAGGIDPRWQAVIRISEFIESDPQPVWEFVSRWGSDADHDVRMAVATCLLEHLLESRFEFCFADMASLAQRDRLFAATVRGCWSTLDAEQQGKLQQLREKLDWLWGQQLDHLVPDDEPCGTFHDAVLSETRTDSARRIWTCAVDLCVGDPDAPDCAISDRRRPGLLTLKGLRLWSLPDAGELPGHGLWLTADGLLERCPVPVPRSILESSREARIAWFLFLSDLNAFAFVAADSAHFTWR
jgi:hypothetical protein